MPSSPADPLERIRAGYDAALVAALAGDFARVDALLGDIELATADAANAGGAPAERLRAIADRHATLIAALEADRAATAARLDQARQAHDVLRGYGALHAPGAPRVDVGV
jgi:hypothetical protein